MCSVYFYYFVLHSIAKNTTIVEKFNLLVSKNEISGILFVIS